MPELYSWGLTAADPSHSLSPPDGWPELTMPYSSVNNSAREGRAVVARWRQQMSGELTTTGAENAWILTPTGPITLAQGRLVTFRSGFTNTGAVTLNVSGTGARPVVRTDGTALIDGDVQLDGFYQAAYDGTSWRLLGSPSAIQGASLTRGDGGLLQLQNVGGDVRVGTAVTSGRIRALHGIRRETRTITDNYTLLTSDIGRLVIYTGTTSRTVFLNPDGVLNITGTWPEGVDGMTTLFVVAGVGNLHITAIGATPPTIYQPDDGSGYAQVAPGEALLLTRLGPGALGRGEWVVSPMR